MEPKPARTRSGLANSVTTPSELRGRPEVGTDVSTGVEMLEAGAGIEVPPTSPNHIPPASTTEHRVYHYRLSTTTNHSHKHHTKG